MPDRCWADRVFGEAGPFVGFMAGLAALFAGLGLATLLAGLGMWLAGLRVGSGEAETWGEAYRAAAEVRAELGPAALPEEE